MDSNNKIKMLVQILDKLIAESEQPKQVVLPVESHKCWKCGTPKTVDLFKGEYCPRCNDWC